MPYGSGRAASSSTTPWEGLDAAQKRIAAEAAHRLALRQLLVLATVPPRGAHRPARRMSALAAPTEQRCSYTGSHTPLRVSRHVCRDDIMMTMLSQVHRSNGIRKEGCMRARGHRVFPARTPSLVPRAMHQRILILWPLLLTTLCTRLVHKSRERGSRNNSRSPALCCYGSINIVVRRRMGGDPRRPVTRPP